MPHDDQRSTITVENNKMIEIQEESDSKTWFKTLEVHLKKNLF